MAYRVARKSQADDLIDPVPGRGVHIGSPCLDIRGRLAAELTLGGYEYVCVVTGFAGRRFEPSRDDQIPALD